MNGRELDALDGTTLINGLTNDVHDTTESSGTDGNPDGCAGINDLLATNETLCTVHGNGTDRVLTKVGGHLKDETATVEVLDLEGVQDGGQVLRVELDINDGTNDRLDGTNLGLGLRRVRAACRAG